MASGVGEMAQIGQLNKQQERQRKWQAKIAARYASEGLLLPGEKVVKSYQAAARMHPLVPVGVGVLVIAVGRPLLGELFDNVLLGGLLGLLLGAAAAMLGTYRVIVWTDRRTLLLHRSRWSSTGGLRVRVVLPKGVDLGALSGTYARVELGGEKLWVHKNYYLQGQLAPQLPVH